MKPIFTAALILGSGVAATVAPAAETIYSCDSTFATSNGFIAPQVVFFVDEAKGKVRVLDGIVQSVAGGPLAGALAKSSDKSYRVTWLIENIETDREMLDVSYRADLNHSSLRYTMYAVVNG